MKGDTTFNRCCRTWTEIKLKREAIFENFTTRKTAAKQKMNRSRNTNSIRVDDNVIAEQQIFEKAPFYDLRIYVEFKTNSRGSPYATDDSVAIYIRNYSSLSTSEIKYSIGTCKEKENILWVQEDMNLRPNDNSAQSINYLTLRELARREEKDSLKVVAHITICEEENPTKVAPDLSGMLGETHLADVTLKCEDYERKCHRVVLAFKSDVFKAMFSADTFKSENVVEIKDTDSTTLDAFIQCIYNVDDSLIEENAYKMLQLADRYDVKELTRRCSEVLRRNLSTQTAVSYLVLAYLHNDICLETKCLEVIRANFATIKSSEDWKSLAKDHPQILSRIIEKTFI